VINTFKPFKSAGTDGIVPAFMQQGVKQLIYGAFFEPAWQQHIYPNMVAGQGDIYT